MFYQHSPFDVVSVAQVVPLRVLLHIVENDCGRSEVDDFPGGEVVQVRSTVPAPVSITVTVRETIT